MWDRGYLHLENCWKSNQNLFRSQLPKKNSVIREKHYLRLGFWRLFFSRRLSCFRLSITCCLLSSSTSSCVFISSTLFNTWCCILLFIPNKKNNGLSWKIYLFINSYYKRDSTIEQSPLYGFQHWLKVSPLYHDLLRSLN